jgi:tRNA-specific 2-thiouridylase
MIEEKNNIYNLMRWVDHNKDQSYFLAWLNQFQLSHSLFPIWGLTKPEVRDLAKKVGLPNAERRDSQGLCFIWNVPIKNFLMDKFPVKKWKIKTLDWTIVWEHDW